MFECCILQTGKVWPKTQGKTLQSSELKYFEDVVGKMFMSQVTSPPYNPPSPLQLTFQKEEWESMPADNSEHILQNRIIWGSFLQASTSMTVGLPTFSTVGEPYSTPSL